MGDGTEWGFNNFDAFGREQIHHVYQYEDFWRQEKLIRPEVQGRANMRPAHMHFLIHKPGYKTRISQVYVDDDPCLETDAQFGVTRALIGDYVYHEGEPAPDPEVDSPWYSLDFTFTVEPGDDSLPLAPVSGRTEEIRRPEQEVWERL